MGAVGIVGDGLVPGVNMPPVRAPTATAAIGPKGRMNTLLSSSGIDATFAQNVGHTLLRRRYCSTSGPTMLPTAADSWRCSSRSARPSLTPTPGG